LGALSCSKRATNSSRLVGLLPPLGVTTLLQRLKLIKPRGAKRLVGLLPPLGVEEASFFAPPRCALGGAL